MGLERDFFARDTLVVARALLGKKLIRCFGDEVLSGVVVEVEAYFGQNDSASHAFRGCTPRNEVMFGPAGFAYVYFVYGLHYMLNVITEVEGIPGAVLLRAIEPLQGQKHMQRLRKRNGKDLTNGPGKLCQAMAIDKTFDRWDLTQKERLWLETHTAVPSECIITGPRVGISYASPEDQQAPWRFWIKGNAYVSK